MPRSAAMPAARVKTRRVRRERVMPLTSHGTRTVAASRSQSGSQPSE